MVPTLGLGCMGMSGMYGPADRAECIATIHAALDAGINLLDTGDFYGNGHNETLIADALQGGKRDAAILSVKFGAMRDPAGGWLGFDARPAAVKNFLTYSLQRLRTDYIDIYRPARLDPDVPIEETMGAMMQMVKAGYVRHIGLSEIGSDTLRRAAQIGPICDLQIEYSILSRGIERDILATCRELGIGITAYGVFSRGLIGGVAPQQTFDRGDFRRYSPRFQGANLEKNLALIAELQKIAADKGVTVAQLAIAWVAAQGEDIVPLVGTRKRERLDEAVRSGEITLTHAELAAIESAVPPGAVAGERYAAAQMAHLDSEK
jgi:aryl-alcohol dehydrogenase-like predicted oxidoreductase